MLSLTIVALEERLQRMAEIPPMIEKASMDAWAAKQSIAMLERDIEERRRELEFDVRTDKETYKNEAARDLAIRQAMAKDDGVRRRLGEIAETEKIKTMAERSLWTLRDEFTTIKYHVRASIAVIEGLTDVVVKGVLLGKKPATDNW